MSINNIKNKIDTAIIILIIIACISLFASIFIAIFNGIRYEYKFHQNFSKNIDSILTYTSVDNIADINDKFSNAISYIENNNLTYGNTSIMWKRPENDVGVWYGNLKSIQHELTNLNNNNVEIIEKNYKFMLLKESIRDSVKNKPFEINSYQNHTLHNICWYLFFTFCITFITSIIYISMNIKDEKITVE